MGGAIDWYSSNFYSVMKFVFQNLYSDDDRIVEISEMVVSWFTLELVGVNKCIIWSNVQIPEYSIPIYIYHTIII